MVCKNVTLGVGSWLIGSARHHAGVFDCAVVHASLLYFYYPGWYGLREKYVPPSGKFHLFNDQILG